MPGNAISDGGAYTGGGGGDGLIGDGLKSRVDKGLGGIGSGKGVGIV